MDSNVKGISEMESCKEPLVDTITYSGAFEANRTRTWS